MQECHREGEWVTGREEGEREARSNDRHDTRGRGRGRAQARCWCLMPLAATHFRVLVGEGTRRVRALEGGAGVTQTLGSSRMTRWVEMKNEKDPRESREGEGERRLCSGTHPPLDIAVTEMMDKQASPSPAKHPLGHSPFFNSPLSPATRGRLECSTAFFAPSPPLLSSSPSPRLISHHPAAPCPP